LDETLDKSTEKTSTFKRRARPGEQRRHSSAVRQCRAESPVLEDSSRVLDVSDDFPQLLLAVLRHDQVVERVGGLKAPRDAQHVRRNDAATGIRQRARSFLDRRSTRHLRDGESRGGRELLDV
jgi:hypothetical protein